MVAATQQRPSRIPVAEIRTDGGTQVRVRIDGDAINDYARVLDSLPPVTVVFDGAAYWLADGFHRVAAHRSVGSLEIDAVVVEGTQRDAVLIACGANVEHGVRRTNRDKRNAVKMLLVDGEWSTWADNRIAQACGVTHPFVGQMRRALEGAAGGCNDYNPTSTDTEDDGDDEPQHLASVSVPTTTDEFVAAARETMGGIDLQASSLDEEWAGRLWLHPRVARHAWSERLLDLHADGRIEQACLMVTSSTGDAWFQPLWDHASCFVAGRVQDEAQVVVYLGDRVEAFERAFSRFGRIVVPTPFGSASLRSQHLRLCGKCGKPCSSGKWCPTCKQHERGDRTWIRNAVDIAQRELRAGKEPSPTKIAVRVHAPWRDVVRVLESKLPELDPRIVATWKRQAALARHGE